jgi:hypothetical protein
VDLDRLIAALPHAQFLKELCDGKLAAAKLITNQEARDLAFENVELIRTESRKVDVKEIKGFIANYAAKNNLSLVLNCSACSRTNVPMFFHSTTPEGLTQYSSASGTQDITRQILNAIATKYPNQPLPTPSFAR